MDAQERQNLEDMRMSFELRPRAQVYNSYKAYQNAQYDQSRRVTIGRFIAFHVDWDGNVSERDRQDFWVGKVTDIDDTEVTVHYYHTGKQSTKDYSRAVFKPWTAGSKHVKVGRDAVIDVFDKLTDGGMLPSKHRKYILEKVKAGRSQPEDSSNSSEANQSEGSEEYDVSDFSDDDDGHGSDTPVQTNRRNQRGGQGGKMRKRKRGKRSKGKRSSGTPVQTNRRSQRGGQGGNATRKRKRGNRSEQASSKTRVSQHTASAGMRRRTRSSVC